MSPLLAGALIGLGKDLLIDEPKARRQRQLAAATQRYSPWTGLQAGPVEEPNALGSAATGALAGAAYGQNKDAADEEAATKQAYRDYLNKAGQAQLMNSWSGMRMSPTKIPVEYGGGY